MASAVDSDAIRCRGAHVQVALHRRHIFSRQHVGAHQVDFSPNLPRQIGQVDARLLGEADRQFLHGADGLQRVAARPGLFREACNRRFADECDVTQRMFGEPRIDDLALELGRLPQETRRSNRRSPASASTSRRETATASGWNVPKAPAPAPSLKS